MGNKQLFALVFLGIMLTLSVALIVVSFDNVKSRYKEIEPNLVNYSTAEVLLLSFEHVKTALLKYDGNDLDDFLLRKDIFDSKIKILNDKSTYSSAFSYDKEFLHVQDELSRNEDILTTLTNKLSKGEASKDEVLNLMNEMDSTLLDLQEVIYKIQIRNFNEVKKIIKDNTWKAEVLSFVSLVLMFLMVVIILRNAYSLREVIKKKNLFISAIYHELASSTQSIVIAADIIEHELVGENLKKEAGIISYHASKILDQTRDVMDYSRLEMGDVNVNITRVNINDLIHDAISEIHEDSDNHFKIVASSKKVFVKSDKYKLYRIIVNLLDNANKYTYKGVITINVKALSNGLYVLVKDTGVGFNVLILKDLFKAFNQGAERETKQGLGLGLTIIKNYVESLKGSIRVKSVEGAGSSFFIFIPVELIEK
jgi:signal transduction histidine kinase